MKSTENLILFFILEDLVFSNSSSIIVLNELLLRSPIYSEEWKINYLKLYDDDQLSNTFRMNKSTLMQILTFLLSNCDENCKNKQLKFLLKSIIFKIFVH